MIRNGQIVLVAALTCFLVFFASLTVGAAGLGPVFDDVTEMLTLFGASLLFVAGVLMLEAAEKGNGGSRPSINPGR